MKSLKMKTAMMTAGVVALGLSLPARRRQKKP
jgi:hypothetical protein